MHVFLSKMTKFLSRHFLLFYVTRDIGVSLNSLGNHLGKIIVYSLGMKIRLKS